MADVKELAQDLVKTITQDKHDVAIRADGMIAGIQLLLQALEQQTAQQSVDIPITDED